MKLKLEVESIPASSWGLNLANKLDKVEWDEIRHKVYEKAGHECQICSNGDEVLNCHEVWEYDFRRKIQRLKGFECLCRDCHDVKHIGRAFEVYPNKRQRELIKHWCKVNSRTEAEFYRYMQLVFKENIRKADIFWVVKVGRRVLV